MIKKILFASFIFLSIQIIAQDITWYGFDFAKCKIVSPGKLLEGQEMKDKYIPKGLKQ